mmetsp:Transcript_24234/g.18437  ORF Transcript_24234/g.18437 Transcript_24234/m.18437 type:complete len:260 (-) Transcript_24234:457-1236(-)
MIQVVVAKIAEISGPPAILKAAALKFFGYVVQEGLFRKDKVLIPRLFTLAFESAGETNSNVQIRNSWLLANLCCILVTDGGNFAEDQYLMQEVLRTAVNYAFNSKEKVIANALRALGYLLASIHYPSFAQHTLPTINSSQLYLSKLHPKALKESELTLSTIFQLVLGQLNNKNPKISWNACVALGKILTNPSIHPLPELSLLTSASTTSLLFEIAVTRSNFKVRIHAMQTLLKLPHFPQSVETWEQLGRLLQGLNSYSP